MKSYIIKALNTVSKDNWEQYFADLNIKMKRQMLDGHELLVFSYDIGADFYNPIVQEARGIIIDPALMKVVCWPFRKFGNYDEGYADKIDWNTAVIQEKLDGSIIKLYYYNGWRFATNSVADANEAETANNRTFMSLIKDTPDYSFIRDNFDLLDTNFTYIFELIHSQNQIVVKYYDPRLILIGLRNNVTGLEYEPSALAPWFSRPSYYEANTLEECVDLAQRLNKNKASVDNNLVQEGFVVVDENFNRIKVKTPEYLFYHRQMTNQVSKERYIDLIINQPDMVQSLCEKFQDKAHIIKYYDYKIAELKYNANIMANIARRLWEEFNDRKLVALRIKDMPLAWVGFDALKNDKTGAEILMSKPQSFAKHIEDYKQ